MNIIINRVKEFSNFSFIKSYLSNFRIGSFNATDAEISEIIHKIKISSNHREALNFLFAKVKKGELEMKNGVLFKKGEYTIQNLFKNNGIEYERNIKKLNSLSLDIVPKHIASITKDNDMFIISKINGTKTGDIIPYIYRKERVSRENKILAYKDMQKLTRAGLIDNKISNSAENWYVTPDNDRIIIPSFEALRPLDVGENRKALANYHRIIFD